MPPLPKHPEHRLGVLYVAGSALAWSVSGVYAKLITLDIFTASSIRSSIGALYMAIGVAIFYRGRILETFRTMGWSALFVAALGAISMVTFVAALMLAPIANVAVINATTPFLVAAAGYVLYGERIAPTTALAAAIALVGVGIMVSGGLAGGHWLGDLCAFVMAASFAIVTVIVRARPNLPMLPVNFLVCVVAALAVAPLATFSNATAKDVGVLMLFAFTSIPLAFFLFLAGARRIPAPLAGLIVTLDVVAAPLIVFAVFLEPPSAAAIFGGVIVLGAVGWRLFAELRGETQLVFGNGGAGDRSS